MAKQLDDLVSLDPAEAFEFSGIEAIGNLYERLLEPDPERPGVMRGQLAESWSVCADGRTYRFRLREAARFASGARVTAEDVAYSLRRAIRLGRAPSLILRPLGLARETIERQVFAEGHDSVVIVTGEAVAPSLVYAVLAAAVGSVVEAASVRAAERQGDQGSFWLRRHSAGSGPYRLRAWRPNERLSLDAVADHWATPPRNKRIVLRHVAEPASQRLLLERGDVDYARNLTRDQLTALDGHPEIRLQSRPKATLVYLALNQRHPILGRPEVVAALRQLVDYDGIARNLLAPSYVVHQSFLPAGLLGGSEDRPVAFDPAAARRLLAEAGLGGGFRVTLDARSAPPFIDIAQAIQASWGQAGIAVEILPADSRQLLTKYRGRGHEVALVDWAADYPDPHANAASFLVNDDNGETARDRTLAWRNSWQDPALAGQVEAAMRERDPSRRAALYEALQRAARARPPFIFLFQQVEVVAHRAAIDGFVLGATPDANRYAGIGARDAR